MLLTSLSPSIKNKVEMKQKIVIKVQLNCEKCRRKAMTLVASAEGVESVALEGEERNELAVIGNGMDCIILTRILRKKVGHADLISVEEVKKKVDKDSEDSKIVKPKTEESKVDQYPLQWYPASPSYHPPPNICSVM